MSVDEFNIQPHWVLQAHSTACQCMQQQQQLQSLA
jgi:hypothetical protein